MGYLLVPLHQPYLLVPLQQPHLCWSPTRPGLMYHNLPQPFKLVRSTSPGGVHSTTLGRVNCGQLHLYNVFGLTHPQPAVSRFHQPCLRLHTGQRHGPRAPTTHMDMIFLCGTRHQTRDPNHMVYSPADRLSQSVCDVMIFG